MKKKVSWCLEVLIKRRLMHLLDNMVGVRNEKLIYTNMDTKGSTSD